MASKTSCLRSSMSLRGPICHWWHIILYTPNLIVTRFCCCCCCCFVFVLFYLMAIYWSTPVRSPFGLNFHDRRKATNFHKLGVFCGKWRKKLQQAWGKKQKTNKPAPTLGTFCFTLSQCWQSKTFQLVKKSWKYMLASSDNNKQTWSQKCFMFCHKEDQDNPYLFFVCYFHSHQQWSTCIRMDQLSYITLVLKWVKECIPKWFRLPVECWVLQ